MKIFSKGIIVGIGLVAVFFTSCKKQLEIAPRQSIDAATALTTRDAIDASILSVYVRLKSAREYGRDLIALPEALADNGFATNKSGRFVPEAQNNSGAHFTTVPWTSNYAGINQINLTLEALPTLNLTPAVTQVERDRWEGQLYFLRGLMLFDIARVYAYTPGATVAAQDRGGVPILTKGVSSADSALTFFPSRPSIDDDYTQIVNDLQLANTKLGTSNLGVNLANKPATQALLAKVNMYRKNYTEAKKWADSCIISSGSKLTSASNYVSEWRKDTHTETLFQVRFASASENIGVNESLQTSFTTLVTLPGTTSGLGGFGDLVPTISLLNDLGITLTGGNTTSNFALPASIASRNTDVRNLLYEVGNPGRGNAKVECTKFLGKNGAINLDNVPVIRIAEVYLLRAEALATSGSSVFSPSAALEDLKKVKSNRYVGYTSSALETADIALSDENLYEEIIRQRRIELAFEGNRLFDLKRLGRDIVKSPHYSNVAFTDFRILPSIPQFDVDANPNLKQNFGY